MARTEAASIRSVIDVRDDVDLEFYMVQAGAVTDLVEAAGLTNESLLTLIETLLAAHYYSLKDPSYKSRSVGKASASFVDRDYWAEAKKLDSTGTLAAMDHGLSIDLIWLGQSDSEKTEWQDRN